MRKTVAIVACTLLTALFAGSANAEDLMGRFAVTGRLGAILPAESEKNDPAGRLIVDTDTGFIGGGGFLYGINNDVAVEIDVTSATFGTGAWGDATVTNLSFGAQYRLPERQRLVPYASAGIDVLIPDFDNHAVDTVLGGHIAGGIDFFMTRQLAVTAEVKGVGAFNADVRRYDGAKVGEFDPSNVAVTLGARYFFN